MGHLCGHGRVILRGMTRQGIPLVPDRGALAAADRRSLIRAFTAKALAVAPGQDAGDVLRRAWPEDREAGLILRAAVSPIDSGDFPAITTASVLPALAPASASARLFARCLQVDLAGIAKVRVPHVAAAPQPGFIAEGEPAPVAELTFAGVDVGPARKILILAAVTGELENATPETASTVIGRALADAVAKAVDTKLFSADAATSAAPAGLLDGLVALTPAATGTDTEMIGADISALAAAIGDADISADDMVIVANVAQAAKLRLLASPSFSNLIIGTTAVAAGTVIGIAPAAVAVGYSGAPEIETSKEALVHFEDTSPAVIGAVGSPNVVAAPTRSAFQSDLIVIRVRARCAWAAVPGAVQFFDAVEW
jgi:Phage capsid family